MALPLHLCRLAAGPRPRQPHRLVLGQPTHLAMGIDDHLFAFGAELLQATKSAPHIISGPDNTRVTRNMFGHF